MGVEILVETARLWASLGQFDAQGRFRIDGVTGPDEYSALVDNNVYTNLMAQANLRAAADAAQRRPCAAGALDVDDEEIASWRAAADRMHVPYDDRLGVHPQSEGFTRYARWDFAAEHPGEPLMMRAPYFRLYSRQVVKQADLVLAMHWCPEAFTAEQKARNVDYYERITVRDSSLSACTQAVLCAEVGHLDLAHDYAWEAALVDLRDLHANTHHGLHLASLAGAWSTMVEGFGGLRERGGTVSLAPRLPEGITGLRFRLRHSGLRLLVEVDREQTRVSVRDGTDGHLSILLYDEKVDVAVDNPVTRPVPALRPLLPRPEQPPGYAPDRAVPAPGEAS